MFFAVISVAQSTLGQISILLPHLPRRFLPFSESILQRSLGSFRMNLVSKKGSLRGNLTLKPRQVELKTYWRIELGSRMTREMFQNQSEKIKKDKVKIVHLGWNNCKHDYQLGND